MKTTFVIARICILSILLSACGAGESLVPSGTLSPNDTPLPSATPIPTQIIPASPTSTTLPSKTPTAISPTLTLSPMPSLINISYKKPVNASRYLETNPPELAVDGQREIWWSAGDFAPQWIEIDLQGQYSVTKIILVTSQSPPGETVHRVLGRGLEDQYKELHVFSGMTSDDQILEVAPDSPWKDLSSIRIETISSPSWIGWREIAIIAQAEIKPLEEEVHPGWTTYTTADGLAHNAVSAIAVAPDGAVWFGTGAFGPSGGGVSRFDGENWTTYTTADGLADNIVWGIAADLDGAIWFATRNGASRFDGEHWTTYRKEDGLADIQVRSVAVAPDGALWFGTTEGGVSRFDGKTWKTYTTADGLAANMVLSIAFAPDSTAWFGTGHFGVSHFDGKNWTTHTTADVPSESQVIWSIDVAPDGTLWFGSWAGGVWHFDGESWTTYTLADGLAGYVVMSLAVDPDGVLWVGTDKGVSRFDGKTWTTYTTADGLAGNLVLAITAMPDGVMWFGTDKHGVSRFEPPK